MSEFPALLRLARLRDRLRSQPGGLGPAAGIAAPALPAGPQGVAPPIAAATGTRLAGPLDVVVTPGELNDLHGTGFLVKRVFAGRQGILSLRVRDDYGGVHDFGEEAQRLDFDAERRPQAYAAALAAVAGREVRSVYSVPYTSADLTLAMATSDVTRAPLCLWEMDDQCVTVPSIPRPLMREFLGKCRLRLATHTELRDAYETAFGLPFFVLPAVVPARLVRPGVAPRVTPAANGALIGSVWCRPWLDRLVATLSGAGERLDWYGNHLAPALRLKPADLATLPLRTHGVVAEPVMADALLGHPFAVVPTDQLDGPPDEYSAIATLSLPGRILFAAAASQTPILIVGSDRTPAAAFVLRHGIGKVVPYDASAFRAAASELRDPAVQAEMRGRAAALAPALSDAGVGDWLRDSLEDGRARDDRFERLFPRDSPPPKAE